MLLGGGGEYQPVLHAEVNEGVGGVHSVGAVHVDIQEDYVRLVLPAFVVFEHGVRAVEHLYRDRRVEFHGVVVDVPRQAELVCFRVVANENQHCSLRGELEFLYHNIILPQNMFVVKYKVEYCQA